MPAPPVPPATSGAENVEKNSAATVSEEVQISPASVSVDASIEDSVVDGFKGSLVKASEIELRLHELVSDAGMMKTQMHVSTYVSPLPVGCILLCLRVVLIDFQWEHYFSVTSGCSPQGSE